MTSLEVLPHNISLTPSYTSTSSLKNYFHNRGEIISILQFTLRNPYKFILLPCNELYLLLLSKYCPYMRDNRLYLLLNVSVQVDYNIESIYCPGIDVDFQPWNV